MFILANFAFGDLFFADHAKSRQKKSPLLEKWLQ
jgi:hypothetical protein